MILHIKPITFVAIFLLIFSIDCPAAAPQQVESLAKDNKKNTAAYFVAEQLRKGRKSNRLLHEKSPYLLQHAFNPVDWFPWGDEAFQKTKQEGKLIFLSIGYSTCHWCHVMAYESFENPEIAAILNRFFISIKVDREERPDLDRIYMEVAQAMTGRGGWPLSVFLTPDLKPFFAGTYFPPEAKWGQPGFKDLLESIQGVWEKDPGNISAQADEVFQVLKRASVAQEAEPFDKQAVNQAAQLLAREYDEENGGFGTAPKFPRSAPLFFLLRHYKRTNDPKSRDMVLATLEAMARGGIFDQVGGGFHRYAVDSGWRVPHFEKMLYDQALLTLAYVEAYLVSGRTEFKDISQKILDYVLREMRDAEGGFYSAEDADSPLPEDHSKHGEGAFYLWTEKEIRNILPSQAADIFLYRFGVKPDGNAPQDPLDEFIGKNILYQAHSIDVTAKHFKKSPESIKKMLATALEVLQKIRAGRPRPYLDDKVLTDWNGLMISGLARGYQVTGDPRYLKAAEQCGTFLLDRLYDANKKILYHRYRDNATGIQGSLADYAFLIQGLLDLYETSLHLPWLDRAEELTHLMIKYFSDPEQGGFFETAGTDISILIRMKSDYDGSQPAANSIAALNLLRLGKSLGLKDFFKLGQKTIVAFNGPLTKNPVSMPQMLAAYDFQAEKPMQIIIAGNRESQDTKDMLAVVSKKFLPNKVILLNDEDLQKKLGERLPFIEGMTMINDKATAYVCKDFACQYPTNDLEKFEKLLGSD